MTFVRSIFFSQYVKINIPHTPHPVRTHALGGMANVPFRHPRNYLPDHSLYLLLVFGVYLNHQIL
nr:MAG TPA: hypothetical protein [Caudoviricetes sp.]